jgi:hypothetical protein
MRDGLEKLAQRISELNKEGNTELQEATRKINSTRLLPLGGVIGFVITRSNFKKADEKARLAEDLIGIFKEEVYK